MWIRLFWFLFSNKDAPSHWRANPSWQHGIVWRYIIWSYSGTVEAKLWRSMQSISAFTSLGTKAGRKCESFAIKAEGKCGGGTSHIWRWRHGVSVEADLQIFGSQDWAKVRKRNCKYLEVQAEMKCGSGTSHLAEQVRNAELQIFASRGRAEGDDLYKLKAFYQILYQIILCSIYVNYCK